MVNEILRAQAVLAFSSYASDQLRTFDCESSQVVVLWTKVAAEDWVVQIFWVVDHVVQSKSLCTIVEDYSATPGFNDVRDLHSLWGGTENDKEIVEPSCACLKGKNETLKVRKTDADESGIRKITSARILRDLLQ